VRAAGWKVRAVEEGPAEIVFVVEPRALARYPEVVRANVTKGRLTRSPFDESWSVVTVAADESLTMVGAYLGAGHGWSSRSTSTGRPGEMLDRGRAFRLPIGSIGLPASLNAVSGGAGTARIRLADAAAAAGYNLGGEPRR
jgi:hypothetical protein